MRKAIAFSSRRRGASESSHIAKVLMGKLRQIITGGLKPAIGLMSHSHKHILIVVMGAGKHETWRNIMKMIILDLLIELQMSVIMMLVVILILEDVNSGRGFTRGLTHILER